MAAGSRSFVIGAPSGPGGVADHFKGLASELARRGHRVTLLVQGSRRHVSPRSNPAVFTPPSRRPVRVVDLVFVWRLLGWARPDCVIGNFAWVNSLLLAGFLRRVPVRIAWYHTLSTQIGMDWVGSALRYKFLVARKRLVYKVATHLVSVSQAARQDLCRTYEVPAERVFVFLNALADPGMPAGEVAPCPGVRRVICSGRFDPCKGQAVLIEALAALRRRVSSFSAELIGDGRLRPQCEALAARLGVGDLCTFRGRLPWLEAVAAMRRARVCVVPSLADNCPFVAIEALALGRPVVASAVGGIPEIVRDGVDGLLVPPGDPEALANALAQLLVDDAMASAMSVNARERFLTAFEATQAVRQQADWLESLLGVKA